jgi:hypothetical protein
MRLRAPKAAGKSGAESVPLPQGQNAQASAGPSVPSHGHLAAPGKLSQDEISLCVELNVFGDSAIRGLIDEWLVPRIVDTIVHDLIYSEPTSEEGNT